MKEVCDYLAQRYGPRSLLRRGDCCFPIRCWPAAESQWRKVESVLGQLDPTPPRAAPLDARFHGLPVFDGEIYAMRSLRVSPQLRMETSRGGYFESLNTCEAMELELMRAEPGLPLREGQELRNAPKRCAAIGVATLLVLREAGKHHVVLAPIRGKGMPHRTGQYHVVPSGMMSPPYSVRETVRTELGEELAGIHLRSISELYFTGVAVNLLNLRPEICTMLVVDHPRDFTIGDEFLPGARIVPFGSDAHLIRAVNLSCRCITPPGAAALFLGARVLRRLLRA